MPEVVVRDKSAHPILSVADDGITLLPGDGSIVVGSAQPVGYGRVVGATAALAALLAVPVGPVDASFEVSAFVKVTVSTTYSFNVTLNFTDEAGVVQAFNLTFQLAGFISTLQNSDGATKAYIGTTMRFRAKAGTTITIATSGTFTTVTYNAEAGIKRVA